MSPQLWAISICLAGSELLRATQRHFDQLKCLSHTVGELSQAMATLLPCLTLAKDRRLGGEGQFWQIQVLIFYNQ
jgi:hypothetical protein